MTLLNEAIRSAIEYRLSDMHICLPAKIVKYDYTQQRASVKPLLKKVYKDGQIDPLPNIVNCPVVFPRSGQCSLTFPVNKDDGCLLVFSERSLDKWLSMGGDIAPDDPRKFDLSDAIALMGLIPFVEPSYAQNNEDLHLRYKSSNLTIKPDGEIQLQNPAGKLHVKSSGEIILDNGSSSKLHLQADAKVALGANGIEVLDILSQTLGLLASAITSTGDAGDQPLDKAGDFAALQGILNSIKGSL